MHGDWRQEVAKMMHIVVEQSSLANRSNRSGIGDARGGNVNGQSVAVTVAIAL